jgi:Zn-dependent protease with chaperone function
MTYKGFVYSDSLENGKANVEFEIYYDESLIYKLDGIKYKVDLTQAEWKLGGFDHNMLYITPHDPDPHKVLLLQDLSLLNILSSSPNTFISSKAKNISGKFVKKKKLKLLGIGVIVLFFVFIGLIVSGSAFNSVLLNLVPVEWDQKLGEYAYPTAISSISPGAAKIENEFVINSMEKIKNRLVSSMDNRQFNYTITVLNSPVQNAFALPGGKIIIFSGLLLQADGPDEVAGILAHEIIHVENRHSMKQIVRNLGLVTLLNVFLGNIEGAAGVIISAGSELLTLGYSRSMEKEADTEGFKLLDRSGIDGLGMIRFFEKLSKDEKTPGPLELLSTHPMSEKRAVFLSQLKEKYKADKFVPFDINWNRVKKLLK